jgi:ubiquinone/menaquinone biosynthesis C-methylase UbiE
MRLDGRQSASEYVFPYPDARFDVCMATSVFTHLLADETEHYINEAARVIKPGGAMLASFFLLNEESLRCIEQGKSSLAFADQLNGCRISNPDTPEAAVAYNESSVHAMLQRAGFEIVYQQFGGWCGRPVVGEDYYQDFLVARLSINSAK